MCIKTSLLPEITQRNVKGILNQGFETELGFLNFY